MMRRKDMSIAKVFIRELKKRMEWSVHSGEEFIHRGSGWGCTGAVPLQRRRIRCDIQIDQWRSIEFLRLLNVRKDSELENEDIMNWTRQASGRICQEVLDDVEGSNANTKSILTKSHGFLGRERSRHVRRYLGVLQAVVSGRFPKMD